MVKNRLAARKIQRDAEMRAIELQENENRKSLTDAERQRTFASAKRLNENAAEAGSREAKKVPPNTHAAETQERAPIQEKPLYNFSRRTSVPAYAGAP